MRLKGLSQAEKKVTGDGTPHLSLRVEGGWVGGEQYRGTCRWGDGWIYALTWRR